MYVSMYGNFAFRSNSFIAKKTALGILHAFLSGRNFFDGVTRDSQNVDFLSYYR